MSDYLDPQEVDQLNDELKQECLDEYWETHQEWN